MSKTEFPTEGVVRLRGCHGKQQGKLDLTPVKTRTGGYLVASFLPANLKIELIAEIKSNPDYGKLVADDLHLDLSDPQDLKDWAWICMNKEIVPSEEAGAETEQALFFVDAPDRKAEQRINKVRVSTKALIKVEAMSMDEKRKLARYLGTKVAAYRDIEVEDYIWSTAKDKPEVILTALEDKNYKDRLLLYALLDAGTIRKNVHGQFFYGDILMGQNVPSAVEWLRSVDNRDIVGGLYLALREGSTGSTVISLIDEFEKDLAK